MKNKRIMNLIGNILMILSFAFIAERIIKFNVDFSDLYSLRLMMIVITSVITYAILVITLAKIFETLLGKLTRSIIVKNSTIKLYCKSNLYKYLPGNIFHYIGRNQIAIDNEIKHYAVIATTLMEMILLIFTAIITSIIFAGEFAVTYLMKRHILNEVYYGLGLLLIAACLIILVNIKNSTVRNYIEKMKDQLRHVGFAVTIKIIVLYMITFIVNAVMFMMVLACVGGTLDLGLVLPIIGMYSLSWVIGFVTPGAPAGIGIREAMMSVFLFGIVQENLVVTAVLLYRAVTIFGDVLGYVIAYRWENNLD
ncbi:MULTISPECIES: lysylphosphatidylglycerol synthase domain-containing protein [unclassified Fusibacter]|uniref:lysylphosphatidylglycerol synthase domain-containing protein n=1 Tax=unclassified Fusibacter TaxID=2624464 RepID=UPI001012A969|nr:MULTISPECIES: lysylphosphatidylglycerol synthase domain-containing protein [unclassified Fusibacter]MCK8059984.1 lysylphosphatidylglycerol synthase domain-containing protein [Fusibacter sp. A2]NPE22124.1 hypothetical protein [Fusibacter sp. A1]RXV60902.1 hypothetical protein DWB64_09780 [Fusibacter sp. A1]